MVAEFVINVIFSKNVNVSRKHNVETGSVPCRKMRGRDRERASERERERRRLINSGTKQQNFSSREERACVCFSLQHLLCNLVDWTSDTCPAVNHAHTKRILHRFTAHSRPLVAGVYV